MEKVNLESQTELSYSRTGQISPLYADALTSCGHQGPFSLCADIGHMSDYVCSSHV